MKTFSGICEKCGFVTFRLDAAPKRCRTMVQPEPRQFKPCNRLLTQVVRVDGVEPPVGLQTPAARDLAATVQALREVLALAGAPVDGLLDFHRLRAWAGNVGAVFVRRTEASTAAAPERAVLDLAGFPPRPLPSAGILAEVRR